MLLLPHVERQQQLALGVDGRPDPVRRPREALHRFGRADLPVFHGTEQRKELIQLDLRDPHVGQEILAKGRGVVRHLDQPLQHGVWVDLEHPGHSADAQTFRQGTNRPHEEVRRDALPMHGRALGLLTVALTLETIQLTPGTATWMAIGSDVATARPPLIRTVGMGAEMPRGLHLARPSPRGDDAGWRAPGRLGDVLVGLLTGGTRGLAGEARKRLRVAGALARWRQRLRWPLIPSGTLICPGIMQHDAEPEESQEYQLVEKEV